MFTLKSELEKSFTPKGIIYWFLLHSLAPKEWLSTGSIHVIQTFSNTAGYGKVTLKGWQNNSKKGFLLMLENEAERERFWKRNWKRGRIWNIFGLGHFWHCYYFNLMLMGKRGHKSFLSEKKFKESKGAEQCRRKHHKEYRNL